MTVEQYLGSLGFAGLVLVAGGTVLWAVLKAKIDSRFTTDLETHKNDLRVAGEKEIVRTQASLAARHDAALAQMQADLRVEATKRERRFDVQHANRVEAYGRLHGLLSTIKREVQNARN